MLLRGIDYSLREKEETHEEARAHLTALIDPIDGTEFIESLQGGWSLIAVYDRQADEVIAAVAGDIFLDRIYWASKSGYPEGLDFITHSWFRLDGGPTPKTTLQGAKINVLTHEGGSVSGLGRANGLAECAAGGGRPGQSLLGFQHHHPGDGGIRRCGD